MYSLEILIVEDNPVTAMNIREELLNMGHQITAIAAHYGAALKSVAKQMPELILMDIRLKGEKDGIMLAETIHQRHHPLPILYLSAYNDTETVERAMRTNPVNYLSKPFRTEDLRVALQIATYRIAHSQTPARDMIVLGEAYRYDDHYQQLYHNQTPVRLSEKERILLDLLIGSKGATLPYAILEHHLWGDHPPHAENALRSLVYKIHSKLTYRLIESVPSFGYRIIGALIN